MIKFITSLVILATAAIVAAQRPDNTSICDYYTTALLKTNTAQNQLTLLTLIVNTALIGNYTTPNVGIAVNGILNPGAFNGEAINLLPYFAGTSGATTNVNGTATEGVNFLDDGGAAPLKMNKPSNGNQSSNQDMLLNHLYQIFGSLLGCSMMGPSAMSKFPSYQGDPSMWDVHRFMRLSHNQMGYFIEQVGMSASSFGAAKADVDMVGAALTKVFDYQCSPPYALASDVPADLQSICIGTGCPLDPMPDCAAYYARNGTSPSMSSTSQMAGGATGSPMPGTPMSGSKKCPPTNMVCQVMDPTRKEAPWHGSELAYPQCYDPSMYVCVSQLLCPKSYPYKSNAGYGCVKAASGSGSMVSPMPAS